MQRQEIIEKAKELIKIRPDMEYLNEKYLSTSIEVAFEDAAVLTNRTNETDFPEYFYILVKDLAVLAINGTGNEGLSSSSRGGVSETYKEDFPKIIKDRIRKLRKLRCR